MKEIVCLPFIGLWIFSHSIVEKPLLLYSVPFVLFVLFRNYLYLYS